MNTTRRMLWTAAADSHIGTVRKVNEDAYLNLNERGLWVVADGMGGHEAGDVASRMIVDTLRETPMAGNLDVFLDNVKDNLRKVNRQIREESAQRYANRTIGSTVVVLIIHDERIACLWVGDSRIYRLRKGQLKQLTRDHSLVQEMVERGMIEAQEADTHAMSNVITRAVGTSENLDIDVRTFATQPGDIYLLCSDGLNKAVTDEEIARLLSNCSSEETVRALIQSALMQGANDNVTTAVVKIRAREPELDPSDKTVPVAELAARRSRRL